MSMQRWDPFDDMLSLRDAMDRLLQESFVRPASSLLSAGRSSLPLDLAENENSYTVHATMPGLSPDDVQINVHGNTLTIHGDSHHEEKQERENYIMRERRAVSYHRSVTLPGPINADHAEARYENGVLTLTLPKSEAARPRQIKVQGSQAQIPGSTQQPSQQATDQAIHVSQTGQGSSGSSTDAVGRASEQSFPASDAPSYNPSKPS